MNTPVIDMSVALLCPHISLTHFYLLDQQINESTDRKIDRSKDRQINITTEINRLTDRQINRLTDQQINRSTDRQIDRSTDRQIDRLTDQQIDRSKDLKIEGSKDRQTKSPFSNNLNKFCYKCLHTVFSLLEKVLSVSTKFVYFRLQNNNNSFNF
jgi:hypothetical protein